MKGFATIWLIALLAFSQAAFALDPPPEPALSITGTIVRETGTTIEVKSAQDDSSVILNLEARPYIVDAVTGQPLGLKDRKTNYVIAYYGPIVTRSLPPRSNPIVIICDVPQEGNFIPPQYGRVESLTRADDYVKVTVRGGSLIVTINRDTPISPYLTRNIVTIDNIEVGSDLLMWYPFVALSYPGQATAQKTVILGRANVPPIPIGATPISASATPTAAAVRLNGNKVTLGAYIISGNNYVKLRDVAYLLSGTAKPFAVSWDGANNAIALTSGRPYTPVGGEMALPGAGAKTAVSTTSRISLDGNEIGLTAYRIDDNNYVALRDLGRALDFGVAWDDAERNIIINTGH